MNPTPAIAPMTAATLTPPRAVVDGIGLSISDEDYLRFREYFYRETGIYFENGKRYFVDRRLLERIRLTGSDSFHDYFLFLRFQDRGEEMQALVNAMTVNETYFFREEYQFRCMVRDLLGDLRSRRREGETLRIWSLPCSSGEEPYSIAMYLLERWPAIDQVDVEIIGSDIDSRILAQAREGLYQKRALMQLPMSLQQRWFKPQADGQFRIDDGLRESVRFTRLNVTDPLQMAAFHDIDLVFCRNLLIYFDEASRRKAVDLIFEAMRPGAYICLGHSESMSRISPLFKVRKFADAIVYQKPL